VRQVVLDVTVPSQAMAVRPSRARRPLSAGIRWTVAPENVDGKAAGSRSSARAGRARRTPRERRDALAAYLLISPALLLFLCFIAGPLIGGIVLSLFKYDLLNPPTFVGLGNYRYLIHDSLAWHSLLVSSEFTVASVGRLCVSPPFVA